MFRSPIIRSLVLATVVTVLAGCASVKIETASIVELTDTSATLQVTTNKNLGDYEDSFFAHLVYVRYRPDTTEVTADSGLSPKPEQYPFSVYLKDASTCDDIGRCWLFYLPVSKTVGLSLNSYSYSLEPGTSITFSVGGGTMQGTKLKSNAVVVQVP